MAAVVVVLALAAAIAAAVGGAGAVVVVADVEVEETPVEAGIVGGGAFEDGTGEVVCEVSDIRVSLSCGVY